MQESMTVRAKQHSDHRLPSGNAVQPEVTAVIEGGMGEPFDASAPVAPGND
jgi:hypothetical protein